MTENTPQSNTTPARDRTNQVNYAQYRARQRTPRVGTQQDAFLDTFSLQEFFPEYAAWRNHPITEHMINMIRVIALTTPVTTEAETQYGISMGAQLAATLMEDPAAIFPVCFTKAKDEDEHGAGFDGGDDLSSYSTPPIAAEEG